MTRGHTSKEGDERVAANGYHYTKTTDKWELTHHLILEQKLGRRLGPEERAVFVDGKRGNLHPDNIEVREKGRGSLRRRKAIIESRISELTTELEEINEELAKV